MMTMMMSVYIAYSENVDNDVAAGNTTEPAEGENVSDDPEGTTVMESAKDYTNDAGNGEDGDGADNQWKGETGKFRGSAGNVSIQFLCIAKAKEVESFSNFIRSVT